MYEPTTTHMSAGKKNTRLMIYHSVFLSKLNIHTLYKKNHVTKCNI